jgi:hypothetical protein
MLTHEFILCEEIPEKINFGDFSKNDMVIIDDDFILKNPIPFQKVEMHSQYLGNVMLGLSYHGISILDNDMANNLKNELLVNCKDCIDLQRIINVLEQGIEQKKYIIHFGV